MSKNRERRIVIQPGAVFEFAIDGLGFFYCIRNAFYSTAFFAVFSKRHLNIDELDQCRIAFVVRVVDEPFIKEWSFLGRLVLSERLQGPETYFGREAIGGSPYLEKEYLDRHPTMGRVPCSESDSFHYERANFNFRHEVESMIRDRISLFEEAS